ncbi:MAG: hypothetical protein JSV56_00305 [Methanomassiliicoccales archaeon]|nr:MAG: hypothetical protein JSV56_00305 [Methanomassiliicoccales archaeon]
MRKALITQYTCPVCRSKKGKLLIVMEPLDYGDVEVLLEPISESKTTIWFSFDIRENNFFYCKNCKMRFSRIDPGQFSQYKQKRIPGIFTDCILKECREESGGRIGTYKDVAIGEIYMKGEDPRISKRRDRIRGLLQKADLDEIPDAIDNFLKEFTGNFTLDQAGICNECGIIVAKEVDLK